MTPGRPMMSRLLRSPLTLFLAVSVAVVVIIFVSTSALADRTAREVILDQAESNTTVLAQTVFDDRIPTAVLRGKTSAIDRFTQNFSVRTFKGEAIESFDILRSDGFLAFDSTDPGVAGRQEIYPLTTAEQEVLRSGAGTVSSFADPDSRRSEDRPGDEAGLVKISTYVDASYPLNQRDIRDTRGLPTTEPALFVAYWRLEGVEARQQALLSSLQTITLLPLLLLVAVSTLMLGVLNAQVRRGSRERERLLQTAIDASDAERRRIARDLHDGVVQDLAGSGFALSGAARDPSTTPATAQVLDSVGASLRDSLKQMRSLLAEIHPPELHGRGLETALEDLIAPAAAAGIHASVSVSGVENASDPEVALVWRVAQEAVRNATRHSGASTLAVTVRGDEEQLLLEVVDDGVGFDTTAPSEPDRFGLRGLRSLVRDVGGELDVTSAVGEGTSVRMAVRR
ncbi:MAG: sensor histidine kinase [Nocardioides sp.]